MRRQLSARTTTLFKYVLPTAWGLLTVDMLLSSVHSLVAHSPVKGEGSPLLGLLLCGSNSVILYCLVRPTAPWRRVSCDENALYVSSIRGEVRIPLSEIVSVQELQGGLLGQGRRSWKPLLVELRHPSPIGRQFQFLPGGRSSRPLPWEHGPHPVWIEPRESGTLSEPSTPPDLPNSHLHR